MADAERLESQRGGVRAPPQVLPAGVTAATVLIMHEGRVSTSRTEGKASVGRTLARRHLNSSGVIQSVTCEMIKSAPDFISIHDGSGPSLV